MDVLFRILHTHLENLKLPQRPVGVRLSLQAVAPARDQLQLFESALRDLNRFGETLAKLKAFLGNEHVGVPARSNTHRPDSYVLEECFTIREQKREETLQPLRGLPLRRFRPAISSLVSVQEGRPISVKSSAIRDAIRSCAGPYRLSGNWWDRECWQHEEWDVALAKGGLYRLSRHNTTWNIEGCYAD